MKHTASATAKDQRKVYKNQRIECDGNVLFFDGKYNPATGILKVYQIHGDVRLHGQAITEFMIDNELWMPGKSPFEPVMPKK